MHPRFALIALCSLAALAAPSHAQCGGVKLVNSPRVLGDATGVNVAISGDTAMVGVYEDNNLKGAGAGKVLVYTRINDQWVHTSSLTASDGQPGDGFGYSIALSGNHAAITLPRRNNWTPRVYFFERVNGAWTETQIGVPLEGGPTDYSTRIAMNETGDVCILGCPFKQFIENGTDYWDAGCVWVFERDANGAWSQRGFLYETDLSIRDPRMYFGSAVSASGDTIAIGAPADAAFGQTDIGSAYVYRRNAQHQWVKEQHIYVPDHATNMFYGGGIAIDGDELAVGAVWASSAGHSSNGAVYTYRYSAGQWVSDGKLFAATPVDGQGMGEHVKLRNGRVLATNETNYVDSGDPAAVHIFRKVGNGMWANEPSLTDPVIGNSGFGWDIDFDGARIIVGAPADGYDPVANTSLGAAYIYTVTADSCNTAAAVKDGSYTGCTDGLTSQLAHNPCGPNAANLPSGPDAWFRYTAPCSGLVHVDTIDSAFDTILSIHTGCPGDANALTLACDDDSGGSFTSALSFNPQAGQTYYLRVSGYSGGHGQFVLTVGSSCPAPCPADFNTSGQVTVQDIFDFLAAYFGGDIRADFNSSGAITVQDIFDYLAAYFTGC